MRSTRIYDAFGSIAINKTDPDHAEFQGFRERRRADYYDPTDLDTEVRILKSDLLALQVIKQLNLDKRPEFGGTGETPPTSLGLTTDALQPDSEKTTALLAGFKGGLRVTLIPNTRIIEIHYRSADKNLAANVVNTLISTYIEQNFKTRFESTMQASDWLSKQLVDLRNEGPDLAGKAGPIPEGTRNSGHRRKAEHHHFQTGRTEQGTDRRRIRPDGERVGLSPGAVGRPGHGGRGRSQRRRRGTLRTSGLMEKMREQQADLKIQVAQLSTQFGTSYPKVVQLNTQLKEVDAQLQTEMNKVVSRVRSGYLAALQHESMLRAGPRQPETGSQQAE